MDRIPFFLSLSLSLPSSSSFSPSKNFVTRKFQLKEEEETKKRKVLIGRNNARTCSNGFKFFIRENISFRERDLRFFFFSSRREIQGEGERERIHGEGRMFIFRAVFPPSLSSGGYTHSRRNKRSLCPAGNINDLCATVA